MTSNLNIFLTGSSGFMGEHLISQLLAHGFSVFALTRRNRLSTEDKLIYIQGDIFELEKHSGRLKDCTYFINLIGEKRQTAHMQSANVDALNHMLEVLKLIPTIKFVQVSSAGIYGIEQHPDLKIDESAVLLPNNVYERTKHQAELELERHSQAHALKYIVLRPTNVFGEGDSGLKLLNLMKGLKAGKFFYLRDEAMVNYLYVGAFARDTVSLLGCADFDGEVYNMNSPISIHSFIRFLCGHLGRSKMPRRIPFILNPVIWILAKASDLLPKRLQYFNSGKYRELTSQKYYSVDRITALLQTNPEADLNQGIGNLVAYYKRAGLL